MPIDVLSLPEEEKVALVALREDASLATATDEMCVRFLRARDLNVKRATAMLAKHLAWREEWQPHTITTAHLRNSLPSGCWRFAGFAKQGQPIVSVRTGLWNPQDYDLTEYIRYVAWFLRQAERQHKDSVSRNVILFDLSGWKLSHVQYLSYIKQLAALNQDHNPERLDKAFLVNVPWIFNAAWAVIRPWLDAKTVAKVQLNPTAEQLTEWIEPAALERCFHGGEHDDYPVPNVPGVPNVGEGDGPCGPASVGEGRCDGGGGGGGAAAAAAAAAAET